MLSRLLCKLYGGRDHRESMQTSQGSHAFAVILHWLSHRKRPAKAWHAPPGRVHYFCDELYMNLDIFRNALILTGPTGCGKTALGVELAERLGAEIISMDSMALYRG